MCAARNPAWQTDSFQLRRACHPSLWQPDAQAARCSMTKCSTVFASNRIIAKLTLDQNTRHHCRKCGMVVCDSCSQARQLLLSAIVNGKYSGPQLQRVCDACVGEKEVFRFSMPQRFDKPNLAFAMKTRQRSLKMGSEVANASQFTTPVQTANQSPTVCDEEAKSWKDAVEQSNTNSQTDDQCSKADTPPKARQPVTLRPDDALPEFEKALKEKNVSPADDEAAYQVLEEKLKSCSYYEGMSRFEPKALRALMCATLEKEGRKGRSAP